MSDVRELKDNELEIVSGGGSGTLPVEGIKFNLYDYVEGGYYYSTNMNNFSCIVYVYIEEATFDFKYNYEIFKINYSNNTWSSTRATGAIGIVDDNFINEFPYRLNVQP